MKIDFIKRVFEDQLSKDAGFKTFIALFMLASIFFMFSFAALRHDPRDPIEQFKIIDAAEQKEFGAFTVKVDVGLFIKNFPHFDLIRNSFIADCAVWFEYDSDQVMLDTIGMFSFDNGDILKKSTPDIKIRGRRMVVKYDVRVSFKSNLEYRQFPLEDHRISLILTNNFTTPQEIYFFVDNSAFQIGEDIFVPDWKVKDLNTEAGYLEADLDKRDESKNLATPKARFTVNLAKKSAKKSFVIFIPLYLAFFLAFTSFFSRTRNIAQRATLSVSAIPALLGYRFVIENLLPKVAYFTTTDKVYILLLILSFFIFIFQILFVRQANHFLYKEKAISEEEGAKRIQTLEDINTITFLVVALILISGSWACIFI